MNYNRWQCVSCGMTLAVPGREPDSGWHTLRLCGCGGRMKILESFERHALKVPKFIVRNKYRIDVAAGQLSPILSAGTFALAGIAAADKISAGTGIPSKLVVLAVLFLPLAVLLVLGLVLDRAHYIEDYQEEANQRNRMLKDIHRPHAQ